MVKSYICYMYYMYIVLILAEADRYLFQSHTNRRGDNLSYCLSCDDMMMGRSSAYIGESSRSGYVRGKQHLEAIEDHHIHQSNAFAKHIKEKHDGKRQTLE